MADLTIKEMTHGYSSSGALEYLTELNAKAITETKEKLADIDAIRTALEKGWAGQAELNFVGNLQKSVTKVQNSLDKMKITLEKQFGAIEENMNDIDKNIVPEA